MIQRFFYLLKFLYNYIIYDELLFIKGEFKFHVDDDNNLYILSNNLINNVEGRRLLDCDGDFVAKVLTYQKRGEGYKIEYLLKEEIDSHREEVNKEIEEAIKR